MKTEHIITDKYGDKLRVYLQKEGHEPVFYFTPVIEEIEQTEIRMTGVQAIELIKFLNDIVTQ